MVAPKEEPWTVSSEPRRSALARPAPVSLIAAFPLNVASLKSPYDRCAPPRSSSESTSPSTVLLHAIGQLLSLAGRCLSISTVHGGADGGGGLGGRGDSGGEGGAKGGKGGKGGGAGGGGGDGLGGGGGGGLGGGGVGGGGVGGGCVGGGGVGGGCVGGFGGVGGGDGGGVGGGGGPAPQRTVTSATAAAPASPEPKPTKRYLKPNDGEWISNVVLFHESPWSPLLDHSSCPAALVTKSVPMLAPYMW